MSQIMLKGVDNEGQGLLPEQILAPLVAADRRVLDLDSIVIEKDTLSPILVNELKRIVWRREHLAHMLEESEVPSRSQADKWGHKFLLKCAAWGEGYGFTDRVVNISHISIAN